MVSIPWQKTGAGSCRRGHRAASQGALAPGRHPGLCLVRCTEAGVGGGPTGPDSTWCVADAVDGLCRRRYHGPALVGVPHPRILAAGGAGGSPLEPGRVGVHFELTYSPDGVSQWATERHTKRRTGPHSQLEGWAQPRRCLVVRRRHSWAVKGADQGLRRVRRADETSRLGGVTGRVGSRERRDRAGPAPTSSLHRADRGNHFRPGRRRTSSRPRSVLPSGRCAKEAL